jgi:predicted DNA-binding transcriptional regulator AlpA
MSTPEPMLTVADIARRLALSEDHVRERLVTRADFPRPAFQIGRTRRWEADQVEGWIRARSARRTPHAAP